MVPSDADAVPSVWRGESSQALGAALRAFFGYASATKRAERPGTGGGGSGRFAGVAGYVGLLGLVAWWGWRAFHDPYPRDAGLAWQAGSLAWSTGHPEHLSTWNGMTFLAAVMSILSRIFSERQTSDLITAANVAVSIGAVVLVLGRVRDLLRPVLWWIAAFGLLSFGPLMSSVWWKQFNLIALGLALAGFELARRRNPKVAALAIGVSISIKPLAFLLPLAMLARRETRRVGAMAVAWIVALDVAGQALMALRAHDLETLDPTIGVRNLIHKTSAAGNIFLCSPLNFSPTSLLCRMNGGFQHWTLQRSLVLALVGLIGLWVMSALRGRRSLDWEVLAFTCPMSIMVSALAWPHYQIMLAPLFVLLLFRFGRDGAQAAEWLGLAVAFGLASLMWEPYGTIVTAIRGLPENPGQTNFIEQYAQLAQYILVLTGVIWYARQRPQTVGSETGEPGGDQNPTR